MKKIIFLYLLLVAIIVGFAYSKTGGVNLGLGNFTFGQKTASATIGSQTFNLLVAKTDKERIDGLSTKSKLETNTGMLFIFKTKDYPPFWMKNMKFPIDIIYISDGKVVDIVKNAKPVDTKVDDSQVPVYRPKDKANYVLEINAGLSDKYNLKPGDKVEFKNL